MKTMRPVASLSPRAFPREGCHGPVIAALDEGNKCLTNSVTDFSGSIICTGRISVI